MPNDVAQPITMNEHQISPILYPNIFTANSATFGYDALTYHTVDIK
jgi:hypothetical protein